MYVRKLPDSVDQADATIVHGLAGGAGGPAEDGGTAAALLAIPDALPRLAGYLQEISEYQSGVIDLPMSKQDPRPPGRAQSP